MIRVAILGLGRIGALNTGMAGLPLNHVEAILATPGMRPVLAVDPSEQARTQAAGLWGSRLPVPLATADQYDGQLDVVVIAGATMAREQQFADALHLKPRVIICEKPLAAEEELARSFVTAAKRSNVVLRVNFNRRFDPATTDFFDRMPGRPLSIHVRYGKGLFNTGSHVVDLLQQRFGPLTSVQALGMPQGDGDPAVSFHAMIGEDLPVFMEALQGTSYETLDLDFRFAAAGMVYADGGAVRRFLAPVRGRVYQGLSFLETFQTEVGPVGGFIELHAAVRDHIQVGTPLGGCTGEDALGGQVALSAVLQSAKQNGARISLAPESVEK